MYKRQIYILGKKEVAVVIGIRCKHFLSFGQIVLWSDFTSALKHILETKSLKIFAAMSIKSEKEGFKCYITPFLGPILIPGEVSSRLLNKI